jgi:serine/threonine protein kinase
MSGLDIDTRSDIYSLGVLLYELLAGSTPFDAKELMASGNDAMRKTIREKDPVRPSTKLSQTLVAANVSSLKSSDRMPTTEEEVRADSRRLLRVKETITLLKGDLDWIVMKCLEKDRTRRYETANGVAADLLRHLADEPVTARAPSTGYKFRKFARRNRVALGVAAAIAFLTLALSGSTFLLVKEFQAGKYGGITIHSDPPGAEVWRGGQKVGNTPFERTDIPIGEFTYSLVLSNYESVTNTTSLAPKKLMNDFTFLRRVEPSGTGTVGSVSTNRTEMAATTSLDLIVLGLEGKVEVARKGTGRWTAVQTNMILSAGDRLRTGLRSRATLRWPDKSVLWINQLTSMEISQPATNKLVQPALRLDDGTINFKRDGTSNTFHIMTPAGVGRIRG